MLAANREGPESGGHVTRKRHDLAAEYDANRETESEDSHSILNNSAVTITHTMNRTSIVAVHQYRRSGESTHDTS